MFREKANKQRDFKKGIDSDLARRKREDFAINLRKNAREEQVQKRRQQDVNPCANPCDKGKDSFSMAEVAMELQRLPELVAGVKSPHVAQQLDAVAKLRKMLSIDRNPPISQVIDSGVVPSVVALLASPDAAVQFEAAWTLTNIASGTTEHTQCVIQLGGIPSFVSLLQSPNPDVAEQAVWALGNIAGDSPRARDMVMQAGGLDKLLRLITPQAKVTMLRNATWAISNLCRGKPRPEFGPLRPAMPALAYLLQQVDEEVVTDACWALSYVSDDTGLENAKIQAVVEQPGLVLKLVQLLMSGSAKIQTPALRTVGNIVTGDDSQTQTMIDAGVLRAIATLLCSNKKAIRKEAAWAISNITAGNTHQIQEIIDADLFPTLLLMLKNDEFDVQKEVAWAVSNACSGGKPAQIRYLVTQGAIEPLVIMLQCADPKIIMVALEGLECILKVGKEPSGNKYSEVVEACGGLDQLEDLQRHDNLEIYHKSLQLLSTYFEVAEEEQLGSAPANNGSQFVFNGSSVPSASLKLAF